MYQPNPLYDDSTIAKHLNKELEKISDAFRSMQIENLEFKVWHVEPDKPRVGQAYYADGSDWNPGSGEGLYIYKSAWVFLG